MRASTNYRGGRPMIMARRGVVSAGHYLAAEAAVHALRQGGNAMDAAAAGGLALTVLEPHQNGIGGEVPILVHSAREKKVFAINGNGTAPAAATIEKYRALGVDRLIPGDGFLAAVVPPAVDTWITLVSRFGRLRLVDVLTPALELAEGGFPVGDALHAGIAANAERFRNEWPSSAAKFMPGGAPPEIGSVWKQPDLASMFRKLIQAEAGGRGRESGLKAARDRFYCGDIAEEIVAFAGAHPVRDVLGLENVALLTADDFASYAARVEEPVRVAYRGMEVHKCGPWTQGPAMLQTLMLLAGFDLGKMGQNSPEYIHVLLECMKLAYADREFYYGDPDFVDVPLGRLLSPGYADERRRLLDMARASMELRPGGYAPMQPATAADVADAFGPSFSEGDTTKIEVADAEGNLVSATPSGGWLSSSPIVPGLGFCLGTRAQMFSMVAAHPNSLQPGKRPRTTLTPTLVTREGRPCMAFGSPGGDCQDQWGLQFFLNVVEFGMPLQEAAEAPAFYSAHFPQSFCPRNAEPGVVYVEGRIPEAVCVELQARGHIVKAEECWKGQSVLAAMIDSDRGALYAAASPRRDASYALGF